MINNLFELVLMLGFWQITCLVPIVLKITKLDSFIPKLHPVFKFVLFFLVLCPLNPSQEISNEFSILNKLSICISSWYNYAFLITKIIMILVPVLFTLKMLGVDLEKIKSWISSGDNSGRVGSSKPRKEGTGEFSKWTHLRPSYMHRIRILRSRR